MSGKEPNLAPFLAALAVADVLETTAQTDVQAAWTNADNRLREYQEYCELRYRPVDSQRQKPE